MAEEFEAAGIYGGNWWYNMMNNTCPLSSSSPLCSIAANNDYGSNYFSSTWQTHHHNLMDLKSPLLLSHQDYLGFLAHEQKQSQNESSPSSASENNGNILMDSTLGFSQPPSSTINLSIPGTVDSSNSSEMKSSMNQKYVMDQQNLSYGLCDDEEHNNNIHLQYQPQPEDSLFTNPCLAYSYNNSTNQVSPSWSKASDDDDHFLKPSMLSKQQLGAGFHFSNNNASSPQSQAFEHKSSCSPLLTKHKREEQAPVSEEPAAFKRPRIETPSPLPTFKVRKEKLGDRITALQQLVSPFGKTDTASVLHEAIEYIKYLHDQVSVLSAPYLNNNGPAVQHYQGCDHEKESKGAKQDLRSQGLCLAPISSTFSLANYEIMASTELWTHAYGGAHHLMR